MSGASVRVRVTVRVRVRVGVGVGVGVGVRLRLRLRANPKSLTLTLTLETPNPNLTLTLTRIPPLGAPARSTRLSTRRPDASTNERESVILVCTTTCEVVYVICDMHSEP